MNFTPVLMFVFLLLSLLIGLPISFGLGFIAISFALVLWGAPGMNVLVASAWGTMNNFTLMAVPLFVFMAILLEKTGIVADLYDTLYKWSGGLRGGLAVATIIVGAILGAVSGVVAAGVIGLGVIALPQMMKYGYDRKLALGSITAGGTLGQMIPPSLNMVVYGAVAGVSVGKMFAGGVTVGIFLALSYIGYILIRSYFQKDLCPALPADARATWNEKFISLLQIIVPLIIILLMLGSILTGATTPTEGAALGCFATLIFGMGSRRLNWTQIKETSVETFKIAGMVVWIILTAGAFGSVFSGVGGNAMVHQLASYLPGGGWGVVIFTSLLVVILGMFLETIAIIMLIGPILSPVIVSFGFDPLWWGLVFMALLQIGYISPPFGLSLFYLKGAVPSISISELYWSSVPFLALQIFCIAIVLLFPQIAIWLPNVLFP